MACRSDSGPKTDRRSPGRRGDLAHTDRAPDEHIAAADELAQWGFLTANGDGSYAAKLPPGA